MGHRRSLLPLALLLLSQVARCYLPPEGPDLRTARIVEPPREALRHFDADRELQRSRHRYFSLIFKRQPASATALH